MHPVCREAYLAVGCVGGQLGEGLLAGPSNSHQQSVAPVHPDDAMNPCQVLHSIIEQHQPHVRLCLIVLFQNFLSHNQSNLTN